MARRCSLAKVVHSKQQVSLSTWQKIDSNWYFYDEDGLKTIGKKNINGSTYYFNQEGIMQTGWAFVDGHWNYFASSGAMKTDWVKDQETWYYLDKDGSHVNWQTRYKWCSLLFEC